ncbi:KN motif and ankyrin repeat domain-containing protein 1-like [Hippocampus comes]|uniref:KN motif and ankyrin repeat domain-containing protein 1-like n=1 Tax=Hippocampus comes TaxID=109280 RepID=UPI00094EA643|nr:PREDICTED: KN motif and ankyrin repeat domain-containing protein 1-like [Hippocampus comes]
MGINQDERGATLHRPPGRKRLWLQECFRLTADFPQRLQNSVNIKRLSLKRRPRAATGNVEKTQSGVSSSQWHSAESLSSSSSDDTRLLGRPPLPPPHGSVADRLPSRDEGPDRGGELKSSPASRAPSGPKQNPVSEQTIAEQHLNVEQEAPSHSLGARRRLASFAGVSSPGSLSRFTGLGAYDGNSEDGKAPGVGGDAHGLLGYSSGGRGSTGCLRSSPQGSGRSDPVSSVGPTQLLNVRDQMAVALRRLRELEEQVKIIPLLEVKIAVLRGEKRQLASQLQIQNKDSDGSTGEEWQAKEKRDCDDFSDGDEGLPALKRAIETGHDPTWQGRSSFRRDERTVDGEAMKGHGHASVPPEFQHRRSADLEAEIQAQQRVIADLKEKNLHLETELKESSLQAEMNRLKLELRAAEARNRVDKASSARPSVASRGIEARPDTTSRGVGNHIRLKDAGAGDAAQVKDVAIPCCGPEVRNVAIGPDLAMTRWEVRERVETREKGVGIHVSTKSQGVGVEVKLSDGQSNTEVPWQNLKRTEVTSVACGDCSADATVCRAKDVVSRGTVTDPVKSLGPAASPQTTAQRSNTAVSSASRFPNARQAFGSDSGANAVLRSQHKHANTHRAASTRTLSVGKGVKDVKGILKTRTVSVGTGPVEGNGPKPDTRDVGVGFVNVHENFLVGLKTQNMASGPSRPPDPVNTRSIGVGEGRIRGPSHSNGATGQQTLRCDSAADGTAEEQPAVLKPRGGPQSEGFAEGQTGSSLSAGSIAAAPRASLDSANREIQVPADSRDSCQQGGSDSEVKRMIQLLEQQTSSAARGGSTLFGASRKAPKKEIGEQGCSNSRKNMRLMRAANGLNPPPKLSAADNLEEAERGSDRKWREAPVDATPARRIKGAVASKASKGSAKSQVTKRCKFSEKMTSACQALKTHLSDGKRLPSRELRDCLQTVQQEWFSVSSLKSASVESVEDYLSGFRVISPSLLRHVANMADGNGNTALHYSVSHSNFGVVQKLLDADVCDADKQNKAGYTPIMLAALAAADRPEDMSVVERLFDRGDVNAKASQAGQTALMLAVSHGRVEMVRALLARGAAVNAQDDEGSTALMCASEHGHAAMVKLLLDQPRCDAALKDSDDSTALTIALEAGHDDIAVLLYSHANFSKAHAEAHQCGRS